MVHLISKDVPAISTALVTDLTNGTLFLWSTVVTSVIECVVNNYPSNIYSARLVFAPEILKGLAKKRKPNRRKEFWFYWY